MNRLRRDYVPATALATGLSIALCWLPLLGPLIAGYVGGRRARTPAVALLAALDPALVWFVVIYLVSQREIKIGTQTVALAPLMLLAAPTAGMLIAGALLGAEGRTAKSGGLLLLLGVVGFFAPRVNEIWRLAGLLRPEPYAAEKNKTCPENLKQLYAAVMLYADSWDGTLPPADRWMTAIKDNVPKDEWLHCPAVSTQHDAKYGYAMNTALGGKRIADLKDRATTPLFYDSTDERPDAHDAAQSLPRPGRHTGRNNIVYADGSVRSVPER